MNSLTANSLTDWAVGLGTTAIIILLVLLAKPMLLRRLKALSGRTSTRIDDALVEALTATRPWLIVFVAVYAGTNLLTLPPRLDKVIAGAATIAVFMQIGLWVSVLLQFWLKRSYSAALATNAAAATSLSAVGFIARMVVWAVVALLALDNLGINISTLIAGLGIGGIAVALAVQNVLGDLFASLSIVIDKPFVIGDFIIVDSLMGTVEHIGLKTTRLRSLDGEQIVMSNSDLLKGRIRNYKRMYERRALFHFSVAPAATPEQLEAIPPLMRRIIEAQKKVRFERAHFKKIGDSAHDFECVFWVTDPDYNLYMDVQQDINFALVRALSTLGVAFSSATKAIAVEGPVRLEVAQAQADRLRAPSGLRAAPRRQ